MWEGSFRCPLSPQHQNPQKNPRTGQRHSLLMVCWEWAWVPLSERSRAECALRLRLSPGESGQGLPPSSSACLRAGARRRLVQPLKVEHPSASRSTEGRHTPDSEVSRRPWHATPWTAARQASLSLTISQSLPKFTSIAFTAIQLPHPDLLFSFCSQSSPTSGTFQMSSVLFSFLNVEI